MSSLSDWNFFNKNVQGGLVEGRFLNAAYTLIAAGPPRLAAAGVSSTTRTDALGNIAFPIGVIQSFNISQSSQIMRVWEIGSERSYFIRGRVMGRIGLGRIMYHGPSLQRVLYAYLDGEYEGGDSFDSLYDNDAKLSLNTSGESQSKRVYANPPGYENLWLDLASDVFSQPIGLLILMRDSNNSTVGAFYMEYANIDNHGLATDAGGTVLSENASLQYERMRPINVQAVELIKGQNELVGTVVEGAVVGSGI